MRSDQPVWNLRDRTSAQWLKGLNVLTNDRAMAWRFADRRAAQQMAWRLRTGSKGLDLEPVESILEKFVVAQKRSEL